MAAGEERPAVTPSVAILTIANAVLFALGAMLHVGVPLGGLVEPVSIPAMMLEAVSTILLGLATMGMFSGALWARRLATFANTFALVAVTAVSMLLGLDGEPIARGYKAMQVLRVVFAGVSLLMLYHQGRERRAS